MKVMLPGVGSPVRVFLVMAVALAAPLLVVVFRRLSSRLMVEKLNLSHSKLMTLVSLSTSIGVFLVYFFALGVILREFGVSLTAYRASAFAMAGFAAAYVISKTRTAWYLAS
jgi:hypothetical protein